MGWIGCVRCEKFWSDFVARTYALIAPVQPILYQASCSNETIQNAPKHYETQQYMSLGSNGVGRMHSLRKIPNWLHGTNLCINCTSSTDFCTEFRVVMKHCQMHPNITRCTQNMSLGSNGVDRVCSLRKILIRLRGKNICINCTSSAYFVPSFVQ